jgi:hypothetical protein
LGERPSAAVQKCRALTPFRWPDSLQLCRQGELFPLLPGHSGSHVASGVFRLFRGFRVALVHARGGRVCGPRCVKRTRGRPSVG